MRSAERGAVLSGAAGVRRDLRVGGGLFWWVGGGNFSPPRSAAVDATKLRFQCADALGLTFGGARVELTAIGVSRQP
jgi:hypothetical protein